MCKCTIQCTRLIELVFLLCRSSTRVSSPGLDIVLVIAPIAAIAGVLIVILVVLLVVAYW